MRDRSLAAIRRELRALQNQLTPETICISILDPTDHQGFFVVDETLYRSRDTPIQQSRRIDAPSAEEAVAQYRFPDVASSKKSILFVYDYGGCENDEI